MSSFSFKKWYLDIADDQGNVYIGYLASLRWGNISLHGYQHLWNSDKNGINSKGGFTKQPKPVWENDNKLVWEPGDIKAFWESTIDPINATLLDTDQGKISWQCLQPKAKASVQSPNFSIQGYGYTEFIEITIPIWKLPIKTLFWGRCHTQNNYLVWIKWDGASKQNLVWHNGKPSHNLNINDKLISGSDFRLKLGEKIPLRQGKLISTVFKPFTKVVKLFPKTTFLAEEHKWYGRGSLESTLISEPATIIYEKVLW